MASLHDYFEAALRDMGIPALPCALTQLCPASIKFDLVGDEKPYLADHRKPSGAYIQKALDRGLAIYAALPHAPELLRIHRDKEDAEDLPLEALLQLGLPQPDQIFSTDSREYFYWALPKTPPYLRRLLREIIRGELDPQGLDLLCGTVYFLNTREQVLFHLQDDRWAYAAAKDPASLRSLRDNLLDWIPPEEQQRLGDFPFRDR